MSTAAFEAPAPPAVSASRMRSPAGLAASLVLIIGVAVALTSGIVFNAYGSEIVHFVLGTGFVLLAIAVFDFKLPNWIRWAAAVSMATLAAIFLLQGIADVTQSRAIADIAYAGLGQTAERVLGDLFILWCALLLILDSGGRTRWLGIVSVAITVVVEANAYLTAMSGGVPDSALKLLHMILFVWLAFESAKPRERALGVARS